MHEHLSQNFVSPACYTNQMLITQLAGAVGYANCITAEGLRPPRFQQVSWM